MNSIEIDKVYEVPYPFKLESVTLCDEDGVRTFEDEVPGVHFYQTDIDENMAVAENMGLMLLTVVSIHKPSKYPERVFYTRKWKKPNGDIFGKNGLKITTKSNFTRMLKGYRHPFSMMSDVSDFVGDDDRIGKIPF